MGLAVPPSTTPAFGRGANKSLPSASTDRRGGGCRVRQIADCRPRRRAGRAAQFRVFLAYDPGAAAAHRPWSRRWTCLLRLVLSLWLALARAAGAAGPTAAQTHARLSLAAATPTTLVALCCRTGRLRHGCASAGCIGLAPSLAAAVAVLGVATRRGRRGPRCAARSARRRPRLWTNGLLRRPVSDWGDAVAAGPNAAASGDAGRPSELRERLRALRPIMLAAAQSTFGKPGARLRWLCPLLRGMSTDQPAHRLWTFEGAYDLCLSPWPPSWSHHRRPTLSNAGGASRSWPCTANASSTAFISASVWSITPTSKSASTRAAVTKDPSSHSRWPVARLAQPTPAVCCLFAAYTTAHCRCGLLLAIRRDAFASRLRTVPCPRHGDASTSDICRSLSETARESNSIRSTAGSRQR